MQSIGERLEEARKRRGISPREASEATKIRGDFLLSFENNQFDIGLPEIYVRGFLRNYSAFLKVEGEKIVTDYNALLIGDAKPARKETRELFGRMELPDRQRAAAEGAAANAAARRRAVGEEPIEQPRERDAVSPEMANMLKIGAIVAIGIILILAIVWMIKGIISGPGTARTDSPSNQTTNTPAQLDVLKIIAVDGVHVTVRQIADGKIIFDGPVARGEERTVSYTGRVRVNYDVGRNLQIRCNGVLYRMTLDGPGSSTFPP